MRARKWIFGGLLVVAVAIIAITVNTYRVQEERERSAFDTALDRAESLGLPIYADHLRTDPIPDEQNAWIELAAISEMTHGYNRQNQTWLDYSDLLDIEDPDARELLSRQMVEDWRPALAIARKAAEKAKFDPPREWEMGVIMHADEMYQARDVCMALIEESKNAFADGDFANSLKSLETVQAIVEFYYSEHVWKQSMAFSSFERRVAEEIIRQVQHGLPDQHLSAGRDLLERMFRSVSIKTLFDSETVIFVESVRLVDEESIYGKRFIEGAVGPGAGYNSGETGYAVSSRQARMFEARAIQAACDFHQSLSNDISDYKSNDLQFANMVTAPYSWDGMPGESSETIYGQSSGFQGIYQTWMGWRPAETPGPFTGYARGVLRGIAYRAVFDHLSGAAILQDGKTPIDELFSGAELDFTSGPTGISVIATAPDLKPFTLEFDRPSRPEPMNQISP